nr:heavy metal-associated domain-containing protein [Meiothermus taiwanensis]
MTCAACVNRVERALQQLDGVLEARVNLATERALVRYLPASTGVAQFKRAIRAAGYGVLELRTARSAPTSSARPAPASWPACAARC